MWDQSCVDLRSKLEYGLIERFDRTLILEIKNFLLKNCCWFFKLFNSERPPDILLFEVEESSEYKRFPPQFSLNPLLGLLISTPLELTRKQLVEGDKLIEGQLSTKNNVNI